MPTENFPEQSDLVSSLASTIQKKIMAPAADKADLLNLEIKEINQRVAGLEKELSLLASAHSRTRLLAAVSTIGVAVLGAILNIHK